MLNSTPWLSQLARCSNPAGAAFLKNTVPELAALRNERHEYGARYYPSRTAAFDGFWFARRF